MTTIDPDEWKKTAQSNFTQDQIAQGNSAQSNFAQGNFAQAGYPRGSNAPGRFPQGSMPQGSLSQGSLPQGSLPQGSSQGQFPTVQSLALPQDSAGILDPAFLTQLANQMFREFAQPLGTSASLAQVEAAGAEASNAATSNAATSNAANSNYATSNAATSNAAASNAAASTAALSSSASSATTPQFAFPASADQSRQANQSASEYKNVAETVAKDNSSTMSLFSFLDDIRPLESYATELSNVAGKAGMPGMNVPGTEMPGMSFPGTDMSALGMQHMGIPNSNMQSLGVPYKIPGLDTSREGLSQLADPQAPGAVAHSTRPGESVFDWQAQMRNLTDYGVIPVLEPSGGGHRQPQFASTSAFSPFDVEAIRRDFPILQETVNGRPLVWLDNAATTQKPLAVIDRLSRFYKHENSNIHRAAHELAARATDAYEAARESVRRFLNASSTREIVFVRGATEAINLVAQSWGKQNVGKDDEIVISWLEHHANIVPWQMLCAEKGARLRIAPVDDHGQILLEEYEKLLGPRTKLVAITQVSNALGTVTPFREMIASAHRHGAKVLLDGAQAISHMRVDMQEYDCDFFVFSGHKVFAPTGIGVLYGKSQVLEHMQPWQGGGNMISDVTFERTIYQQAPMRFEAGTGSIGDAVGLGAAIEYLERVGMVSVARHEHELMAYATEAFKSIPGLRQIGTAANKAGVLSFVLDGYKTEEVSAALNKQGIAVRAGHHCAQPILRRFGVESTVRPSLALYNTCQDIDTLIAAIWNLKQGRSIGPV